MGVSGSITISGGTVTAYGSPYGAGIGGGGCSKQSGAAAGAQASGNITISGGKVTAVGGAYAPGIGSGAVLDHDGKTIAENSGWMGSIVISGGNVTATNGNKFVTNTEPTGKSFKLLNDSGEAVVDSGIGQGANASQESQDAFAKWAVQTVDGAPVLYVKKVDEGSVTYTRNGKTTTVKGADGATTLYLPEGYYVIGGERLLVATAENQAQANAVKAKLEAIQGGDVTAIQTVEKEYNALSASLRYYVDKTVADGHTLSDLKKQLEDSNVEVTVKLDPAKGTINETDKTVIFGKEAVLGVPTRPNYVFTGWYLNDERVSGQSGVVTSWQYISDVTLTAHWGSEVTGKGTESDPYVLLNGSNMVALSHISMNIGTDDEYAVFGKSNIAASRAELLAASYTLGQDIELKTSDGYYGIGGNIYSGTSTIDWSNLFSGTFDGNNHTIHLDIDTTTLVSDEGEGDDDNSIMGHVVFDNGSHTEVLGGVFNYVRNCTIKNVKTTGSVKLATKKSYAAVLVGSISNSATSFGSTNRSVIENCTNEADMTTGAVFNVSTAAGIVGNTSSGTVTLTNCKNSGTIIAGAALTLKNGHQTLAQGNSIAAGIASTISCAATFTNCENTGAIQAIRATELGQRSSRAGGICAFVNHKDVTMTDCTNYGSISSEAESINAAGGIAGTTISTQPMTRCVNYGTVFVKDGHAGAIFGAYSPAGSQSCELVDCAHVLKAENADGWKLSINASVEVAGGKLVVPVTDEASNFFNADRYVVNGTAKAADLFNADGSQLYNDLSHNNNLVEDAYPFQTESDAYVISNAQQYMNLVKAIQGDEAAQNAVLGSRLSGADTTVKAVALASAYVKLSGDLTLSDVDALGLGTSAIPFSGTIDGQNHTVTYAISVDALGKAQTTAIGLVGVSAGAAVKNLNLAGTISVATAEDNDKPIAIGPAVADGSGAVIENCHSTVVITAESKCTVNQATMGMIYAGGLVGIQSAGATVKDSTYEGSVTVTAPKNPHAGGIAGSYAGTMENVSALGDITANEKYVSGVARFGENSYAGGIAGEMSGELTNVTAGGTITATNDCSLSGVYAYAGGLVGNSANGLTVKDSKALTTVKTSVSNGAQVRSGILLGFGTADAANTWYIKTDDTPAPSGMTAIDTTVLSGEHIYGSTVAMAVPEGVTMVSDYASLDNGAVSFINATTDGKVELVYNGQVIYTGTVTVKAKQLTADDVTITGINSSYASDADAAKAAISVICGTEKLVPDTDYTVSQNPDTHEFTITFQNNYDGSVSKGYDISDSALNVTTADYNGVYDGEVHSISVSAAADVVVKYSETESNYSSNSIEKKDAGNYIIYWQATQDGKTVTGSAVIHIEKAALTITADDQSMYVNGDLPDFTYTVDGLVKDEQLITTPTLTCDANGSTAGSYSIVPGGAAASANYTISYVNGTLTVSARSSSSGSSSSGSSYVVSAPSSVKNGKVSVDPKSAKKGTTVTITVTPDKGYELGDLVVKDASGKSIQLTDKGNGKYTFVMPASKVTVSAEFNEVQTTPVFADVPAGAYCADAVAWAVQNGITNGLSDGTFGTSAPCTRGQIVTFLWRAAGSPAPKGTATVPADVVPGSYCYNAVAWALENGITKGLADGTFGVNNTCTRAQGVTFLYRAMDKAPSGTAAFTDVAADSFCADAVAWAVENGVTNGTTATTFSPNASCTRGQIVTFLYRAYQGK